MAEDRKEVLEEATPADNFIVDWDGEEDPENPLNWPPRKKAVNIALLSCLTFVTYVIVINSDGR